MKLTQEKNLKILIRRISYDRITKKIKANNIQKMKAISIKQPWASLIVHNIKNVENRTWKCPEKYIGQRVLIHASAKWDGRHRNMSSLFTSKQWNSLNENTQQIMVGGIAPTSAIIGSAVIKECVVNHPSIWAEKTKFYVELEKGLYLASGQGDPSRTLSLENACLFCTVDAAEKSISKARKYRPFKNAKVIAPKPIYNWVLESPTLYEEPIPAKGNLSYWGIEEIK